MLRIVACAVFVFGLTAAATPVAFAFDHSNHQRVEKRNRQVNYLWRKLPKFAHPDHQAAGSVPELNAGAVGESLALLLAAAAIVRTRSGRRRSH